MNKKHFIIPTLVISLIISLIALLIPLEVKNNIAFIIALLSFISYNLLSLFIITKNIKPNLKEEIPGLAIYYIYGLFNIFFIILLFVSKFIYINTNLLFIIANFLLNIFYFKV